jgi:glycosyltransferase involved in cell wall biosynthesis
MSKILFVWDNLVKGGAEVAMVNLSKKICNKFTVDLLLVQDTSYFFSEELAHFHQIYIINEHESVNIFLTILKSMMKILSLSKKYDYIIVNDTIIPNLLSLIFFIFGHRKIILWSHLAKDYFINVRSKYGVILNKFILKYVSYKIICVSKLAKLSMISHLPYVEAKTSVIYNVIKKPLNIKAHSGTIKNIITISRLSQEKRIDVLIKAFALVVTKGYDDLYLTIGGYGDELNSLQSLVEELNLKEKVKFTGEVKDPYHLLLKSDLFVSSSVTETFSISVAEALLCGVPAISTRTGANEMLQDGKFGIVVDVNDFVGLSQAIIKLLEDKKLFEYYISKTKDVTKMLDDNEICSNWIQLMDC